MRLLEQTVSPEVIAQGHRLFGASYTFSHMNLHIGLTLDLHRLCAEPDFGPPGIVLDDTCSTTPQWGDVSDEEQAIPIRAYLIVGTWQGYVLQPGKNTVVPAEGFTCSP